MRIMFVIPRMNGGGAERVIANLASEFSKKNEILVCALVSKESFYDLNKKNITFISAGYTINRKSKLTTINSYRKNFFNSLKFIKNQIKNFNPDCVISFLVETDILTYLACKGNKHIMNIYSERNDPTRRKKFVRRILKHIYKSSDLFICQSKKVFDYYDYIPDNKKVIISNPLDYALLPSSTTYEDNHDIVSMGRLTSQKNYKLLINSFIKSIDKIPDDCRLVIYGEGKLRSELEIIIKDNKMEERILLPGSQKDVLNRIKGASLYVLSSDYEGFPNSLLEAMAIGLPVISTDYYTGISNEIIGKDNGIVVPIGDEEKLSEAIIKMMNDEKYRKTAHKENIKLCKDYDVKKIASIWMKSIKKVVGSNE